MSFRLFSASQVPRRQMIVFALVSAVLNGAVTASVGAWLAQTYATGVQRRGAIEAISNLLYERRIRATMTISALRRGAELDEVRHRKRAYDEAFVEWNKRIRLNLFAIREVMGARAMSDLEQELEDRLVKALADLDRCLTRAYDHRLAGLDPVPVLEACDSTTLAQFTLDCGATFTNELYKLSQLNFIPFMGVRPAEREAARARIIRYCTRPEPKPQAGPAAAAPAAPAPATAAKAPAADGTQPAPPAQPR
jgi:hypothetical protein